MARVTKRWRLDPELDPMTFYPTRDQVEEALWALSLDASPDEVTRTLGDPLAGVLVALVAYLARANGSFRAVDLDQPSHMESPDEPAVAGSVQYTVLGENE